LLLDPKKKNLDNPYLFANVSKNSDLQVNYQTRKDYLQVALDVTANGKLPLPPQLADDSPSRIYNITLFLYSYDARKNYTISNGTAGAGNASLGNILGQEPGSTVKHVNWVWPSCLVGNGGSGGDRGGYNVSKSSTENLLDGRDAEYNTASLRVAGRYPSGKTSGSMAPTTTPSSTCQSKSQTASPAAQAVLRAAFWRTSSSRQRRLTPRGRTRWASCLHRAMRAAWTTTV
jgi:hypothetical protein